MNPGFHSPEGPQRAKIRQENNSPTSFTIMFKKHKNRALPQTPLVELTALRQTWWEWAHSQPFRLQDSALWASNSAFRASQLRPPYCLTRAPQRLATPLLIA